MVPLAIEPLALTPSAAKTSSMSFNELSIAMIGLSAEPNRPWGESPRSFMGWAARVGFRGVQLDATARGLRARDLGRSARRDLAASLRRLELEPSGFDFLIPAEHLLDPTKADHAMIAMTAALELAGEVCGQAGGDRTLTVRLPEPAAAGEDAAADTRRAEKIAELRRFVSASAERHGVRVGDLSAGAIEHASGMLGVAVDPSVSMGRNESPGKRAARAGERLASARLSDAADAARVVPGSGDLELLAYAGSLSVTPIGQLPGSRVVLDLRGVADAAEAAETARQRWADATAMG